MEPVFVFQAHVGVALLNAVPPTRSGNTSSGTRKDEALKLSKSKKSKPEVSDLNGESSSRGTAVSRSDSASHSAGNRHLEAAEMQRQRLKKLMEEMNEEGDGRSA